jgi:hypothetical protein
MLYEYRSPVPYRPATCQKPVRLNLRSLRSLSRAGSFPSLSGANSSASTIASHTSSLDSTSSRHLLQVIIRASALSESRLALWSLSAVASCNKMHTMMWSGSPSSRLPSCSSTRWRRVCGRAWPGGGIVRRLEAAAGLPTTQFGRCQPQSQAVVARLVSCHSQLVPDVRTFDFLNTPGGILLIEVCAPIGS